MANQSVGIKMTEETIINKTHAANSMTWGSAAKGTLHKIYYEDELEAQLKIEACARLQTYKDLKFGEETK